MPTPFSFPSRSNTPGPTERTETSTPVQRRSSAQKRMSVALQEGVAANAESLTALAAKAGPEESLHQYRLLEAIRGGDSAAIVPLLNSAPDAPTRRQSVSEAGALATDGGTSTPLHIAVRCGKHPTVELVLKHQPRSLNAQDARGQTPLHLAASLNRVDVVALFLLEEQVDDMIKDNSGKTALEVAGGPDTATLISVSRSHYNESYLALLAAYVASPASEATTSRHSHNSSTASLVTSPKLAQNPLPTISDSDAMPPPPVPTSPHVSAASGHVSNVAAEKLYHFIAKPRSRCIDFAARDQATGTTILHEAAKRKDLAVIKLAVSKGADILGRDKKGKLPIDSAKDERIKSVLRQAASSEGRALRAAASDPSAGAAPLLGAPPAMRGYLSKWTNMARGYRTRWFVLDNGVLSYYRTQEDEGKASRGSINMSVANVVAPGVDKLKFEVNNKLGKSFPSFWLKGNHPVEVMRWVELLRQNADYAREGAAVTRTTSNASTYATSIPPAAEDRLRRPSDLPKMHASTSGSSPAESFGDRDGSVIGDDETFNGEFDEVPHFDDFDLLAQGTKTQLELTQQLLNSLVVREDAAPSTGSRPSSIHSVGSRQADVKEALKGSLSSLEGMLDEYIDVVAQRERYFVRKYEREIDAKRMWEDNMKEVAAQHAAMEVELQKASRDNTRRKRALQEVRANLASAPEMDSAAVAAVDDGIAQLAEDGSSTIPPSASRRTSAASVRIAPHLTDGTRSRAMSGSMSPTRAGRLRSGTMHTLNPRELEQVVDSALAGETGEASDDSDDDDEFFEAIEAGQIPISEDDGANKRVPQIDSFTETLDLAPYKGYEHLRTALPLGDDTRPPVSLWAILKGSIGKDLTKISFPVFFNEPCSMLQRMAEDIEFSECLDGAASDPDSTKRIAYIAAFAASNYSSTIGRIAKPFNPMLGETFEYVSLDKKYRYVSEQVCHHPPISACIAQAPAWEYFGEVDAKSKFLGKSFEIRPTGIAHVNVRIPKEWAPEFPPAGDKWPDMVTEHYSWTKVTTSVSNFLFGNPIIDHYGDMVVTNHRTGDTCTLTFKPRGWRGGNACEIKGKVVDKAGKEHWDIAGKWSSQLVARRVGEGHGDLAPDASVPTTKNGDVAPEYIRLWKNSEKPPGMPFNLTPFAVTLNDTNPDLKSWLPPTDCRLRPDQHAFESGKFEHANNLKTELEEHQRTTRRMREKGELPPHKARWFSRGKDADTGESYWQPAKTDAGLLEYWEERNRVGELKAKGEKVEWNGVDPIFGDFQ